VEAAGGGVGPAAAGGVVELLLVELGRFGGVGGLIASTAGSTWGGRLLGHGRAPEKRRRESERICMLSTSIPAQRL
jgi:hypothetical protein